jgi:RNA polymerase-binding protein DksA
MKKERLDLYRSNLLERRKFVLETIERLREISQIKEVELDLNEKYSDHLADQASDSMGREESFMFISRELQYLYRIDNALTSIDHGKYGICKICGKEIPYRRLEAVPTTDTCVNCKNSLVIRRHLN